MKITKKDLFDVEEFVRRWGAPIVARSATAQATGGLYKPKFIANADANGQGPEGRYRIGGKIVYPTEKFAMWLFNRSRAVTGRKPFSETSGAAGDADERRPNVV